MPMLYRSLAALLLTGAACGLQAQTEEAAGLRPSAPERLWPHWQGRLLVTTGAASVWWRPSVGEDRSLSAHRLESLSLLGDYYFARRTSEETGFRATSGLIHGQATNRALSGIGQGSSSAGLYVPNASAPGTAEPSGTVPYLGLGYTSPAVRGGWGFSADIGLLARSPGSAIKLGRVFNGTQPLDELLREMRLSPLLNIGVSYSF